MKKNQFLLTSEECELLLELEKLGTIEKVASEVRKDPSGVSRQLSKIAKKYPALEKRNGKWVLTEIGKQLNSISRSTMQVQRQLAEEQTVLRIGTNREFSARIIAPQIHELKEIFQNTQLIISCFEHGTERPLLNGQIDIGIDCERPQDPDIAYKLLVDEPIVTVCSKSFYKKYGKDIDEKKIDQIPHLLCERLYPDRILMQQENRQNIVAYFNDIASARSACVAGAGWALLPRYAVKEELKTKKLIEVIPAKKGASKYGVWWLRTRYQDKGNLHKLCDWVKAQEL